MKSPNNYRTLETHKHALASPMKSSTMHKIPYLPLLGFKFEDVINNRLNSENGEAPKSIFFLKGNFKKDHGRAKDKNINSLTEKRYKVRNELLPQVSISTTLESRSKSEKRKNQRWENEREELIKTQTKSIHMYIQKPNPMHTHHPSFDLTNTSIQNKPKIHKSEHEKRTIKEECKLDEMVIGNKTILNFRSTQSQNKKYEEPGTVWPVKKTISHHKTKIKFGTFVNPLNLGQELCPWGFTDRTDDHS